MKITAITSVFTLTVMVITASVSANPHLNVLAHYSASSHSHNQFVEFSNPNQGNKVFVFDPRELEWYAYGRNGRLLASGPASGGQNYCRDIGRGCKTPSGTFKVHSKGTKYCKSSKYPIGRGGAPMPYCMFFHRGYAIHGSPDVPNYNASHGCIRVLPNDARWLHQNFIDHGTTVIVRPY